MTIQQPTPQPSGSAFGRAVGGFFRFLVRFLFVLVVGALIGLGLFYAVPGVFRALVQPVQRNTARLAALEQRVTKELIPLREGSAVQAQDIAGTAEQIQELGGRVAQAEQDLVAQHTDLAAQQEAAEATRSELGSAVDDLEEQAGQTAAKAEELEGRLALLQTAQDLLKVRLMLVEENPRGARDTLLLATAHLEQAIPLMPEQAETLSALQGRMVGLEALIAEGSFRVGPELESLWADVMDLVLPAVVPPAE